MSQPSALPPLPPSPPRNGCLTALLIGVGILMLLPGLCAVVLISFDPRHMLNNFEAVSALFGFFAISAGGIVVIWLAVRRPLR